MKKLLSTIIMVAFFAPGSSYGQIARFDNGYALVFPLGGEGFSTRAIQIDGDSIICFAPELRVYAKEDIRQIMVRSEPSGKGGFITGGIVGIYVMHYAIGRAHNQPAAYLDASMYDETSSSGIIWPSMLGLLVGGGLGHLLDASPANSSANVQYIFGGNPDAVAEQWQQFSNDVVETSDLSKIHISLSGGSVSTVTADGYKKMLQGKGFSQFDNDYYNFDAPLFNSNYTARATNFNILRKAAIEYSITDNIQTGIAFTWLGEPILFARKDAHDGISEVHEFLHRLDGKGYYGTGSYHYSILRKPNIELTATAGLGIATINHYTQASYRRFANDDETIVESSNAKTYFSFILSGGINIYLNRNLTLGFHGNYFYGGSAVIAPIGIIEIPAMDVTYGSTDIGFTIGMHF